MHNKILAKTVTAAVMAALICVATMIIQIPMPFTNGYVNFGDCFILVCAVIIGGRWGFAAAGVGSAMADLITGYAIYVPATFVIKGLMAVVMVLMANAVAKKFPSKKMAGFALAAVAAELVMSVGYFLYAWIIYGGAAALSSIPGNLIQGGFGVVCGLIMLTALEKTGALKKIRLHNI